jgi:hypothetical protein
MSHTKKGDITRQVVRIGLDIAKSSFQVHGVDAHGGSVKFQANDVVMSESRARIVSLCNR